MRGLHGWDAAEDGPEEEAERALAAVARGWGAWVGLGSGAVLRGQRHLDVLVAGLTELLESLDATAGRHPSDRVLDGFLAACPLARGDWELDTLRPELRLRGAALALPPTALGDDARWLRATVVLGDPSGPHGVGLTTAGGGPDVGALRDDARLPVLADALRDHLVTRLRTSAVLVRTPPPGAVEPGPDALDDVPDDEAGPAAEHVLRLLARLEAAVHRAAGSDGGRAATDGDLLRRRRDEALDRVGHVHVDLRQRLPAGLLEPTALALSAAPGRQPDGGPIRYHLVLDLTEGRRGVGRLEVEARTGRSVRRVRLPGMVELWLDHVESALHRAHVAVPALRPTGTAAAGPVPPPVREPWTHVLFDPAPDVPF